MQNLVAAVDVGTGSARAGILDAGGRLLGRAEQPIAMRRPLPGHAEHDSEQIWHAVCAASRAALREAGAPPGAVAGLAFDATCSLVVRDAAGDAVGVSADGGDRWDTIAWLDHRALAEAAACTATGHPAIAREGGAMSPEMQLPKLMWLKSRLPGSWARAGRILDLADHLAWRACGTPARSLCTLACKWTYRADAATPWQADLLAAIGLADLLDRAGIDRPAVPVGTDLGPLGAEAAAALGLTTRCRVAAGLIDAHAGALGVLGGYAAQPAALERQHALIAGTSSCVMALARAPRTVPGIWGPHFSAILPGLWLAEGGQSASGALLDHVCRIWSGGSEPTPDLHRRTCARIAELRAAEGWDLARRLHVLPDFHGNRSPFADPAALGVISGLSLDHSFDGLCRLYWRTAVAIALGLRQILERMAAAGPAIRRLHAAGGHTRNPLLMELYAAATGAAVVLPGSPDPVLLGTGMAAAAGAGLHAGLAAAAVAMHQPGRTQATDPAASGPLERDYRILLEMQAQRRRLDELAAALPGADAVVPSAAPRASRPPHRHSQPSTF